MALAIFDLDHTLLAGDSDLAWGEYLVDHNYVDTKDYAYKNNYFYQQYLQGIMDINEFLEFALQPLAAQSMDTLNNWHKDYLQTKIKPMLQNKAMSLLQKHRDQGDTLLIITATNSFVAGPICELHKVDDYIATVPEIIAGRYTGKVSGTPSYQAGKITRLNEWLAQHNISLQGSYGYSDSINDLPLLQAVDNPCVVDADDALTAHALQQGWPCMSLRD
jgi:HAD superfamily hydrolase (TIGR01490 family)